MRPRLQLFNLPEGKYSTQRKGSSLVHGMCAERCSFKLKSRAGLPDAQPSHKRCSYEKTIKHPNPCWGLFIIDVSRAFYFAEALDIALLLK